MKEARKVLGTLSEDTSLEQVRYRLNVAPKIEAGLRDAKEGRLLSKEEAERRMEKWLDR